MRLSFFGFFIMFNLLIINELNAQTIDSLQIKIPQAWLGHWQGDMQMVYASGKVLQVKVELEIKQISPERWAWKIFYIDEKNRQERAYELFARNSQKGNYAIDEKNSIILEAFYSQNTLQCVFNVQNNMIYTVYRLENQTLSFENTMHKANQPLKTGGKGEVPVVDSYTIFTHHKAVLRRKG
jgi:hypothetical protein